MAVHDRFDFELILALGSTHKRGNKNQFSKYAEKC